MAISAMSTARIEGRVITKLVCVHVILASKEIIVVNIFSRWVYAMYVCDFCKQVIIRTYSYISKQTHINRFGELTKLRIFITDQKSSFLLLCCCCLRAPPTKLSDNLRPCVHIDNFVMQSVSHVRPFAALLRPSSHPAVQICVRYGGGGGRPGAKPSKFHSA